MKNVVNVNSAIILTHTDTKEIPFVLFLYTNIQTQFIKSHSHNMSREYWTYHNEKTPTGNMSQVPQGKAAPIRHRSHEYRKKLFHTSRLTSRPLQNYPPPSLGRDCWKRNQLNAAPYCYWVLGIDSFSVQNKKDGLLVLVLARLMISKWIKTFTFKSFYFAWNRAAMLRHS